MTRTAQRYDVTVTVADIPAGATATLTITTTGVEAIQPQDQARCVDVGPQDGTIVCDLSEDSSPVVLSLTVPQRGTVTATITTEPADPATGNNTLTQNLEARDDRANAVEP